MPSSPSAAAAAEARREKKRAARFARRARRAQAKAARYAQPPVPMSPAIRAAYSRRADPKTVAQGLVVGAGYLAASNLVPLEGRLSKAVRAMLKVINVPAYRRYVKDLTLIDVLTSSSKAGMGFGLVVVGMRAVRRSGQGARQVVLNEPLQPGEVMIIRQVPRKTPRKQRRQAANPS